MNNYAYLVTDEPSKDSVVIDPAHPPEYAGPKTSQAPTAILTLTP